MAIKSIKLGDTTYETEIVEAATLDCSTLTLDANNTPIGGLYDIVGEILTRLGGEYDSSSNIDIENQ